MKGIVVTPQLEIRIADFVKPLYKSVGEVVGGGIEIIHPRQLPHPFVMIGDDEALLRKNPVLNAVGSYLYETHKHGHPICGTVVFMAEGWTPDGPDIIGLEDDQIDRLAGILLFLADAIKGGVGSV